MRISVQELERGAVEEFGSAKNLEILSPASDPAVGTALGVNAAKGDAHAVTLSSMLKVENLHTHFYTRAGVVKSVNGVSFQVDAGETLAVVGESGSGKSVTSLSVMRLIDAPGRIVSGSILLRTKQGASLELTGCSDKEMRRIRGNDVAMVFQEPMTSLNPAFTAGDQIAESITLHQGKSRKEAFGLAVEMLALVGIPAPEKRVYEFPHQMSGGMRQRVMIAIALSSNPALLIADEPTTALDVTIQAQILELLRKLQSERKMGVLLITHNLGVVAETASRVAVMYAGRIVEEGLVDDVFRSPKHPYTIGLLASMPRPGSKLEAIPGNMPSPFAMPPGCAFAPRCKYAVAECSAAVPELVRVGDGHSSRCLRWREL
jgi:oligopeptide/dipeptide ABC transporter ATP-binding protein